MDEIRHLISGVIMGRVDTDNLKPGMVLEVDVYNYNDQLILPEGLVLNEKAISKLAGYGVTSVRIKDDAGNVPKTEETENSYATRLRATPEFKKYKEDFESTVNLMTQQLSDVVKKNAPLDAKILVDRAFDMLHPPGVKINVFDMVHNMRQYDDITFAHSLNVGLICNVFAMWLGLSEQEVRLATECGLLHDIGKLAIPEDIIKKPDKLTKEEFEMVKTHPLEGYKILQRYEVDDHVKKAALMHHEKCDGTGYPLGLTGDSTDYYAKLVAIADVYEAMTASRQYRMGLCPFTVIEAFEDEGLQKYDTAMIMTFLEKIVDTYMMSRVRLSNGMEGDIIFINKQRLSRPTVKCGDQYIDLAKQKDLRIEMLL